MELVNLIKDIIRRNKIFAILLILLAIIGGVIHTKLQKSVYISDFQITNGDIDYSSFKTLNDFNDPNSSIYSLIDEIELDEISDQLKKFRISYVQNGKVGINFTLTTLKNDADHKKASENIVTLLNNNVLIKDSEQRKRESLLKKLSFIERKIADLDSIMNNTSSDFSLSKIPSDSYNLYSEQLDLENEIFTLTNFEIIKPVTKIVENRRSMVIFLALYLFLAILLFIILARKKAA